MRTRLARHSPIRKPEHEQPPAVVSNEDLNAVVASPAAEVKASTSQGTTHAAEANGHAVNEETTQLLQEQKQTIALLVSEKASLAEKVEQFDGIDIRMFLLQILRDNLKTPNVSLELNAKKKELQLKSQESDGLRSEKERLEKERASLSSQVAELQTQVSQVTSKSRDLVRSVPLMRNIILIRRSGKGHTVSTRRRQ